MTSNRLGGQHAAPCWHVDQKHMPLPHTHLPHVLLPPTSPTPLPCQVYLRITLSKSRAEVLQLEALENIAACMAPKERRTPSGRQPGGRTASRLRLDLFRAVSFARKLAESLAEQTLGKA